MDVNRVMTTQWHIPRPSLSSAGSIDDSRSRGGSASSQGSSSNHSTHSVSSGSLLLTAAHLVVRMNGRDSQNYVSEPRHESRQGFANAVVSIPEETVDTLWKDVKRGSIPEQDSTSLASSTHFTVVNGFTKHRPSKEPKTCCCRHSHQITVLVICMTILFSACILAAICYVEMRMRRETGMYKYS